VILKFRWDDNPPKGAVQLGYHLSSKSHHYLRDQPQWTRVDLNPALTLLPII
jgi:hypothetical protein